MSKSKKGGKREGAGRPKGSPTVPLYMRVPEEHYEAIKKDLKRIVNNYKGKEPDLIECFKIDVSDPNNPVNLFALDTIKHKIKDIDKIEFGYCGYDAMMKSKTLKITYIKKLS